MATNIYVNGDKVSEKELKNITIKFDIFDRILLDKLSSINSKVGILDEKSNSKESPQETLEHLIDYKTEVCYSMDLLNDFGQSKVAELAKKLTMIPECRKGTDEPSKE